MTTANPLKWLLAELPAYVEPGPLASLMERYEANKRAYDLEAKIRRAERIVRYHARRNDPRDTATIARWQAKLSKLKEKVLSVTTP